eukprot:snap_masked-scaffold_6-processed-gene-11.36-mRNA-1 protein AED:1.00 eAED:1.00 QI:0/-1/0/0/-1/1/1/0/308
MEVTWVTFGFSQGLETREVDVDQNTKAIFTVKLRDKLLPKHQILTKKYVADFFTSRSIIPRAKQFQAYKNSSLSILNPVDKVLEIKDLVVKDKISLAVLMSELRFMKYVDFDSPEDYLSYETIAKRVMILKHIKMLKEIFEGSTTVVDVRKKICTSTSFRELRIEDTAASFNNLFSYLSTLKTCVLRIQNEIPSENVDDVFSKYFKNMEHPNNQIILFLDKFLSKIPIQNLWEFSYMSGKINNLLYRNLHEKGFQLEVLANSLRQCIHQTETVCRLLHRVRVTDLSWSNDRLELGDGDVLVLGVKIPN